MTKITSKFIILFITASLFSFNLTFAQTGVVNPNDPNNPNNPNNPPVAQPPQNNPDPNNPQNSNNPNLELKDIINYNPSILKGPIIETNPLNNNQPVKDPLPPKEDPNNNNPKDEPRNPNSNQDTPPDDQKPINENTTTNPDSPLVGVPPKRPNQDKPVIIPTDPIIPIFDKPEDSPEKKPEETCPVQVEKGETPPCPVQPNNIIPKMPINLILGTIFSVFLFGGVFYLINSQQLKSEKRSIDKKIKNEHQSNIQNNRQKLYSQFIDFITVELTSNKPLNSQIFSQLSSKLELLGSKELQNLNQNLKTAYLNNDKKSLKILLSDFAKLAKKEF